MPDLAPVLADTITKAGNNPAGRVIVTGSHGGIYAAYLARQTGCRAVIFNDAGVGLNRAGIGGLAWLEAQGMAAAAVCHATADIGNAEQMYQRGRLSHVNETARNLGLTPDIPCGEAVMLLGSAAIPNGPCPEIKEGREVLQPAGALRRLVLVDSAGLVITDDAGAVVITGSHGALFGGDPRNALKADAFLALFNDAGGGIGTTRLPALDARRVAAATVAANSACIGDARSTWEQGVVSAINPASERLGAIVGMPARDLVSLALARAD